MKILHIIPTYLPSVNSRGVIDAMHFLNKQLVRKGVEVSVYTTNSDGVGGYLDVPTGKEVDIDGVKVFYFEISFPRRWCNSRAMRKFLAKTTASFDVVHITSVFLAESTIGAHYARKFKKPCVITPHGSFMKMPLASNHSWFKKIYISLVEKRNLKNAFLHFMTEPEKEQYSEAGFPCRGIFIIPNAFEPGEKMPIVRGDFRRRAGIAQDSPLILFLGRLDRIKGLDTLLPAFADVLRERPEAVLVLAGPDDEGYKKNVQELVSKFQLGEKVIFAGMLTGEGKAAAFLDADVFAAPSYSENFGMAIAEAMHFGLPVVVAEGVGIASYIERAKAGIVIKKNEEELTAAILKLLNEPDLRKKMGEAGKELVREEFSSERVAEEFIKEYNKAIQS
jgi:glycosyltransferase involved in cell wall biosynthesis